jgi:molecular chaperone DnaK (HSP70)
MVLTKMKKTGEAYVGKITNAMITVPVDFNDSQK